MLMTTDTKRDGRVVNRMDDETRRVHFELTDWARYALGGYDKAWPAATPLSHVIDEGITGAGQATAPIEWPERVMEVEHAVRRLGDIDQRVIKTYYGTNNPIEVMARDTAGMRVKQFENVLRRARTRILGFLDGIRSKSI